MALLKRKYEWPDDHDSIRQLDDDVLKKLWRYAPVAKTEHQKKCSLILCDELIDRGLK